MPNYTNKEVKRQNGIEAAVLVALLIGFIVFMYFWNKYQPERERKAYEAGVEQADRRAAAAGGWGAWIAGEVAKMGVRQ